MNEVAVLTEGLHFGELALIKAGKKRTATVITNEDSHFVVLDKESYLKAMGKAMQARLHERVEFLKNYNIFEGFNKTKLENLTYFLHKMECKRGQVIYTQGKDKMDKIFFIKVGEFEIQKTFEIKNDNQKLDY